ncbi:MAG: M20 family metallopeptidase [Acidimicrobiales bacterium]|jgi:amidohydrolase
MTATQAKEVCKAAVTSSRENLIALSHKIHDNPETGFAEERAAAWCADELRRSGYEVEVGVCGLPTSVSATIGSGPLVVAICAEYDALPELGHACGHNVIASAAVGASLGLAPIADDLGLTVRLLGTPAEEGGGGKILMMERGAFDGVNAALMVHPAPTESDRMPCLAVNQFDAIYTGREAHAAGSPERGINAADALTISQVAIGLLRQHSNPGDQVHGIVTCGGAAPNIVPAHTSARFYVRAETLERLAEWEPRVRRCFEAGALATGACLEIVPVCPPYSEFVTDEPMAALYRENAQAIGRVFPTDDEGVLKASTDMANVSRSIPSIHPLLAIDSLPAVNHQPGFADAAAGPAADRAVIDGALGMAWTVIDLATEEPTRARLLATSYRHG